MAGRVAARNDQKIRRGKSPRACFRQSKSRTDRLALQNSL